MSRTSWIAYGLTMAIIVGSIAALLLGHNLFQIIGSVIKKLIEDEYAFRGFVLLLLIGIALKPTGRKS